MSENNNGVVTKPDFAAMWKLETMTVEFPSGLKAEVTKPDALSVITQSNELPDTFFAAIMDSQSTGKSPTENMSPAETRDFMRFMLVLCDQLAIRHFENPRISENPGQGEISINDFRGKLSMEDRLFFTNWAMEGGSPVDALKRFRDQQPKRLPATQNGGNL